MKFGVREIANVVFKAKSQQKIGPHTFEPGQPVLYIDSAKTSNVEGAATTVYAQGGRGNARLIAWEGEKTLTFTVEDALLSPISFSMLSGAGLLKAKAKDNSKKVHFHQTSMAAVGNDGIIDLRDALNPGDAICPTAPIYIMIIDETGDLTGETLKGVQVGAFNTTTHAFEAGTENCVALKTKSPTTGEGQGQTPTGEGQGQTPKAEGAGSTVMVDYYVIKDAAKVSELQIDAENFAGYYYVEADTLFRVKEKGYDLPANITFPNVKIQSNFTFSMASSGDPSTFTFTMDAMPGYTYFDKTRKVLCAIQIVDDAVNGAGEIKSIFPHKTGFDIDESQVDSVTGSNESGN